jgi:predicted glycosyltransferase
MKILFYLNHPAHFHLFKNVIRNFKDKKIETLIVIRKKDVLEELLKSSGFKYSNITSAERNDSKFSAAFGLFKQIIKLSYFCVKNKPTLIVGTPVAVGPVGKLTGIPSINVEEDDAEVIPLHTKIAYPLCKYILAPNVCSVGKWENKKIEYAGYHELAYLHPNNFFPDKKIISKYSLSGNKYFIIRFVKLTAHHDEGIKGINIEIALKIISLLQPHGKILITSERKLEPELEPYRINIDPVDIHHVMAYASLYIGDSQTMAAEAGVLGVPFIRFNDFVGRIGYLNELENKYQLGYGIKTENIEDLFDTINKLLNENNTFDQFQNRRSAMLSEKIDVSLFFTWLFENYPQSISKIKNDPNFLLGFK